MNGLVIMKNQQVVTSSVQVAKTFGKQHKHVLESIKNLVAENSAAKSMFAEGSYENRGKEYRMSYMNRDGFTLLAMGFTGNRALEFKLKYISAFNQMENEIKTMSKDSYMIDDRVKRAEKWITEEKERQRLALEVKKDKPKADYFDKQMKNPGLMTTTVIAKSYGMTANKLNKLLNKLGVIYKQGKNWIMYDKYAHQGYADYEQWSDEDNKHVHMLLKWTSKGRKLIYDMLSEDGIDTQIELLSNTNKKGEN
ncbi:antirepressor [Lactobacillus phage 3-SAC12]|nr:antirepressor [Lactobacillus phage 3-SAC12]